MVFWILLGLVPLTFIFTALRRGFKRGFKRGDTWSAALVPASIAAVIVVISVPVLMMVPAYTAQQVSSTHSTNELSSLKMADSTSVKGEFFLGSGVVSGGSDPVYSYMYQDKDENGQAYFKPGVVKTSESRIYESDDAKPKVDNYSWTFEHRNAWLVPWSVDKVTTYQYNFTVPSGSVVQNYQPN